MHYRKNEINQLVADIRWLDQAHARNAFAFAHQFINDKGNGLNHDNVNNIQTHKVDSLSVSNHWLMGELGKTGTVQLVFSEAVVGVISCEQLLDHWQEIFAPSIADIIVLHNKSDAVLFYYHEDVIEFGQRLL